MNKKQVSEDLNCSPRTVENYVKRGKLSVRYEKGATSDVAVFDPFEVRRLKAELQARSAIVPVVTRETPEREPRKPEIAPQAPPLLAPLSDYLSRIASALEANTLPELLSPEQVSERLSLPRKTVLRLAREGKLGHVRVGRLYRFRPDDLKLFIKEL